MILWKGRKALGEGTIREWNGKKYKKTNGKWVPVGTGRGRGRPKKNVDDTEKKDDEIKEKKNKKEDDTPKKRGRPVSADKQGGKEIIENMTYEKIAHRSIDYAITTVNSNIKMLRPDSMVSVQSVVEENLDKLDVNSYDDLMKLIKDKTRVEEIRKLSADLREISSERYNEYKEWSDKLKDEQAKGIDVYKTDLYKKYLLYSSKWDAANRLVNEVSMLPYYYGLDDVKKYSDNLTKISDIFIGPNEVAIAIDNRDGSFNARMYLTPDEAVKVISYIEKGSRKEKYLLAVKTSEAYLKARANNTDSVVGKVIKQYEDEIGIGIEVKSENSVLLMNDLKKRGALKRLKKVADVVTNDTAQEQFFNECMDTFKTLQSVIDMRKYSPPDGKKLKISIRVRADHGNIAGTYSEYDTTINIQPESRGAIVHEMGHYFWERDKVMQTKFLDWVSRSGLKDMIDKSTNDVRDNPVEWNNYIDSMTSSRSSEMIDTFSRAISELKADYVDMESTKESVIFMFDYIAKEVKANVGYYTPKEKTKKGYYEKQQRPDEIKPEYFAKLNLMDSAETLKFATSVRNKHYKDKSVMDVYANLLAFKEASELMRTKRYGGTDFTASALSNTYNWALRGNANSYSEKAGYWLEPTEMFARTFRNYVSYKAVGKVEYSSNGTNDEERDKYRDTYGWGFEEVDPDDAMIEFNDGELGKIIREHIGEEVIKSMVRFVMLLEKGRKPLPEGTVKEWQGKKYKKQGGKWFPVGEGRGRGRPKGSKNKVKLIAGTPEEKQELIKTKEFKKWFGKSAVVQKNGDPSDTYNMTPVKVYHGTASGGHRSFDIEKIGNYNIHGPGFYFTEDEGIATEYMVNKGAKPSEKATAAVGFTYNGEKLEYLPESFDIVGILKDATKTKTNYSVMQNPNWGPSIAKALENSYEKGKGYNIKKLFDLYHKYQVEEKRKHSNTQGKGQLVTGLVAAIPGLDFIAPEPELYECYMKIEKPFDMDAEISREDYSTFIKTLKDQGFSPYIDNVFYDENSPEVLSFPDDTRKGASVEDYTYDVMLRIKKYLRSLYHEYDSPPGHYGKGWKKGEPVFPLSHFTPENVLTGGDVHYLLSNAMQAEEVNKINKAIRTMGYDGIHHTGGWNIGSHNHSVWIAFYPTQIKSTKNEGTFDSNNPDIYKSSKVPLVIMSKSLTWSGFKLQGRCKVHGMNISIENKKGSVRKGVDKDGHEWRTKMHFAYGYIRGTVGKDKDHLDCYIGPNKKSEKVFIVHQNDPVTGNYDEDKVMLGFDSAEEAKAAYLKQYDRPGFFGSMDETSIEKFKETVFKEKNKGKKLIIKSKMSRLAEHLAHEGLYKEGMKKTWTQEQEDAGTDVEMEHTSDRDVARQIACDHLVEDSEYYTKLKKMEAGNEHE